jgi:epoxyqueuosine reductase
MSKQNVHVMRLTKRVKDLAYSNDIDYVGIAPVGRFENAPEGHRPGDLLPGAESVISMGIRVSLGPQLTQRMALASQRKLRHVSFSYRWFGYGLLNMYFLDRAAFLLNRLLEEEGYVSVPIVASGVEDTRLVMAAFSNRHAAVAAGLGEFGWNGICSTPDVGPRARFVSVITTAKLAPDPMYSGPKLCDPEKCKKFGQGQPLCIALCPINCFSHDKTDEVIIGGKRFEYAWMDHMMCGKTVGIGLHPLVLGPKEMVIPKKIDFDTSVKLRAKTPPKITLETVVYGRGHFCGLCMLRCPIGAPRLVENIMKGKESMTL